MQRVFVILLGLFAFNMWNPNFANSAILHDMCVTSDTSKPELVFAIPSSATGRHLRIRIQGASDALLERVSVGLRINGDAGANYTWVWEEVTGGPPKTIPASGGGDEVRARVGIVPAAAIGTFHVSGILEILIPNYRDVTFVRSFLFNSGATLNIEQAVSVRGYGAHFENRTAIPSTTITTKRIENVGYRETSAGMANGQYDPSTKLWYDTAEPSPPNHTRVAVIKTKTPSETNKPAPVSSVTLLLDVGRWTPGTRIQIYAEE